MTVEAEISGNSKVEKMDRRKEFSQRLSELRIEKGVSSRDMSLARSRFLWRFCQRTSCLSSEAESKFSPRKKDVSLFGVQLW